MRSYDLVVSYNNGGSGVLAACMTLKLLVPGEISSFDVYGSIQKFTTSSSHVAVAQKFFTPQRFLGGTCQYGTTLNTITDKESTVYCES